MERRNWTLSDIEERPIGQVLREVTESGLVVTIGLPDGREVLLGEKDLIAADAKAVAEQRKKNQAAIDLLDSWENEDEEGLREQRETWEYLKKALDEDRLSYRKLFP